MHRLAEVARAQGMEIQGEEDGVGEIPDYWGYQTCTEFAFYQTCELGSRCFFTQVCSWLDLIRLVLVDDEERLAAERALWGSCHLSRKIKTKTQQSPDLLEYLDQLVIHSADNRDYWKSVNGRERSTVRND